MRIVWTVRPWERWTLSVIAVIGAIAMAQAVMAWREAHMPPVVTRYELQVDGLPADADVSIAFLSDTHVNEARDVSSIDLERLTEIVAGVNSLKPEIVLLGGDYITATGRAGDVPLTAAVAPFKALRSAYGTFSVVGNHDCGEDENTPPRIVAALTAAGTRPLVNDVVVAGPVVIAGLDDLWCGNPDIGLAARAVRFAADRPLVMVSHNPDAFPQMPGSIDLTLAGHTHAAQIVLPLYGPVVSVSAFGQRFRYGHIVEMGRHMIVTAGIGGLPLRLGARPEIVLVRLTCRSRRTDGPEWRRNRRSLVMSRSGRPGGFGRLAKQALPS